MMNAEAYQKILSEAISNEIEAYEFYRNAADKSADANLKSIFSELSEEELKHKKLLESFLNNEKLQMQFRETADYKVAESVALPKLSPDMSFTDGIALAMKKEEEAMSMYLRFAEASQDPDQKNAFLQLATMEQGHKTRLETLYTNTAYQEAW